MRWYEATCIGVVMGCLYGLVLWAAVDALFMASFILYNNPLFLPTTTTVITMSIAFICLFSYPHWAGKLEQMIVHTITKEKDDDE
jgi:hypothetical protein